MNYRLTEFLQNLLSMNGVKCKGSHKFSLREMVLLEVERVKNKREPFLLEIRVREREKIEFRNSADLLSEKLK